MLDSRNMAQLFAGSSGFAYAAWKPEFYPQKVASKDFLKYYATRLNAVEPASKAATLENGVNAAPAGFVFRGGIDTAHCAPAKPMADSTRRC